MASSARRAVRSIVRAKTRGQEWLAESLAGPPEPTDVTVRSAFLALRRRARSKREPWRPQYAWPVLSAARTAHALGIERISVVEFGVAGGNGLLALEAAAAGTESLFNLQVDVFGFDMGTGLPAPTDVRDAPFALRGGEFPMDEPKLRSRLQRAELLLGPVSETVERLLGRRPPPIGFVAFDLDYYSSTVQALEVLDADAACLLPRVFCYFDDVLWYPWTQFNGERAAIADFNSGHANRKISPLHGVKYALPGSDSRQRWPELMFIAELFDHPRYGSPERAPPPDLGLRG